MTSDLTTWQEHLEHHFAVLRDVRGKVAPDQPVFALEHGLADQQLDALFAGLRGHVANNCPLDRHHLAWVVYAAEFGYIYAGDEYWQTFEDNTPGWTRFGDRNFIRRCFAGFHSKYHGARPTGAWANHFSIICWPITHAILPRDMQTYLAEVLYNVRHILSQETLESPRLLGELVAAHGWRTSSRFQQLLQEPLLVGQIAAALLMEEDNDSRALILPDTLARISGDLAKEQRSRNWLRSAREIARDKIAFHRLGKRAGRGIGQSPEATPNRQGGGSHVMSLEPRISLRQASNNTWDVFLELPDLSSLGYRYPKFLEILTNTRFSVVGSSGRHWPAVRLLHSRQQVQLRKWPEAAESLICLERSAPELEYLLATECAQRPDAMWAFKIASDGSAGEVSRTFIRPDCQYIVVCTDGREIPCNDLFTRVKISCEGIWAVRIDVPPVIDAQLAADLRYLEISYSRTTHVWPVGLIPSRWDGEGRAEWLTTDHACIALRADHSVEGFRLALEDVTLDVVPDDPGAPVFVQIPELDVGTHHLYISEITNGESNTRKSEVLEIRIRNPRPPSSGIGVDGAFLVLMDPAQPSLEQLWQGNLNLEVLGPPTRQVTFSIRLYRKSDHRPILQKDLPPVDLPLRVNLWRDHFFRHFCEKSDVQNAYDVAHMCEVRISARELGVYRFQAEREFTALRWIVHRSRDQYRLELLDDRDTATQPEVLFYPVETPDCNEMIGIDVLSRTASQTARPGLYVARADELERCVIIPPLIRTLGDLAVHHTLRRYSRNVSDIKVTVCLAMRWKSARVTGDIFSIRIQRIVVESLFRQTLCLVCGERWAQLERELVTDRVADPLNLACRTVNSRAERELLNSIATRIDDQCLEETADPIGVLAVLSQRHLHLPAPQFDGGTVVDNSLRVAAAFALYLASYGAISSELPEGSIDKYIAYLMDAPGVLRAARFMELYRSRVAPTTALA
ncbi:MAG: hypothetical protein KF886_10165 [Candidatus Hydrogenedentes bacterium]|nr:hypothetical protein [Candidatus Hydrogenedentota bacterium]